MNRIRKINGGYQVLITPNMPISPDSALLIGNWDDEDMRNFSVLTYQNLNDAQAEAFKHPDIDWHRLIINHRYIYERLDKKLRSIIKDRGFSVNYNPHLMSAEEFKNTIFERVLKGGERFNLRYGMNDIISFTITNPWSNVLHKVSKAIETHRDWLYLDVLRIRNKRIVDGKIIVLEGITEFGTVYEIRFVPSLINQWGEWYKKAGHVYSEEAMKRYQEVMKKQKVIDEGMSFA